MRIRLHRVFVHGLGLVGDWPVVQQQSGQRCLRVPWHGPRRCTGDRVVWAVGVRIGLCDVFLQRHGLVIDWPVVRQQPR